ncbi:hypothetical protein BD779DRAFT_1471939 [Infundibulicybe gibba]|nr:hypothetical protein BD779DRAFT_1471939 [Infundibulicybe gibba]
MSGRASLVSTHYPPSFSRYSMFSIDEALPEYSSIVSLDQEALEADEALPSPRYSFVFRPEPSNDTTPSTLLTVLRPTEHQLHLTKKGHNWATLRILTTKYMGGENIRGAFELMLDKSDPIHSISISGDPNSGAQALFPGRLSGRYNWPFSFAFPTSIPRMAAGPAHLKGTKPTNLSRAKCKSQCSLRTLRFNLPWHITFDSRIQTSVVYVPRIMPEPASALRQAAYLERQLPPCPREDPIGWHMLPSATIHGLVGERPTEMECTLSLARPCNSLAVLYTWSCNSMSLTVRATLPQDLDLLVKPETIVAHLRRRVIFHQDAAGAMKKRHSITPLTITDDRDLTVGVWWPQQEAFSSRETYQREMHGEIHLPEDLQPSCDFPSLSIEYYVVILPFNSPYFSAERGKAVISQPIRIATVHAPGPIPEPISARPSSALLNSRLEFPGPYDLPVTVPFWW